MATPSGRTTYRTTDGSTWLYIAAYKAGDSDLTSHITGKKVIYWYRQNMKSLDCDATDTTMVPANNASGNYFEGDPNGADDMQGLSLCHHAPQRRC
jgi:hypothetical protein